ncbi:DUF927 domain-containing protein [Maricaulis salignorans]|uniref:DUF927 domain-containing protein n=1 Tax=Maricaulis salignorans TaxID=144026 RepID=UPI003A944FAB
MTEQTNDPFGRVRAALNAEPEPGERRSPDTTGELVAPVPDDAPARPDKFRDLGTPSRVWTYRDATGAVLRHTLRFDQGEGEKEIRPLTLRRAGAERVTWRLKSEPGDARPLYGLDRLAARPSAPVLLSEGEKDADGAAERFPDYVSMTWPGGSNAIGKADFGPLKGRSVAIWPDADTPGLKAAKAAQRAALSAGAKVAGIVTLPDGMPDGWGLSDAWPAELSQLAAQGLVTDALTAAPLTPALPYGFRVSKTGLEYEIGEGEKRQWMRITGPFTVEGEARDPDGGAWSVVIKFRDRDGREKTEIISRGDLARDSGSVRARLADEGLQVPSGRGGKVERFAQFFNEIESPTRLTLVAATGWASGGRFVLPQRVFGPDGSEPMLFTGDANALHYRQKGSLTTWQNEIAAKAAGNELLLFALSIGFAGPLLRPLNIEGGGFHFRGGSSTGKTTLAYAAGSIWGGGGALGAAQSWRSTANALEMIAYGHSETLLVLDELGLVAPEEAGQAAYALASGQAKGRAKADGSLRRRSEWRTMLLSTGEIGLADHIRSGKRNDRVMAGQELRLLDIRADAGKDMGIWEALHGASSPAVLSDQIKTACAKHYGFAGPAFVERYVSEPDAARARAGEIMAGFLEKAQRPGDHGQAQRAALRFALVAAAGELAAAFKVVPWQAGDASNAALQLFDRWASAFGRSAPREKQDIVRRLKGAIEQDQSRFAAFAESVHDEIEEHTGTGHRAGEARSLKTLGYTHTHEAQDFFLFHDTGWAEVFAGFDLTYAARVALEGGFLSAGDGKHLKRVKKYKGKNRRFYWIDASILEAEFDGE